MWQRLFRVLPQQYIIQREEQNNLLTFLLNSSFLSALTTLFCFLIWLFQYSCTREGIFNICDWTVYQESSFRNYIQLIPDWDYLIIAVVLTILSYVFYRASITPVTKYAFYVQTGFDLYRFELLRQLNLPLPQDSEKKLIFWNKVSELLVAGRKLETDFMFFDYHIRYELLDQTKKEDAFNK